MEQLKVKDEEYVNALKKQNDDVDELIKNMRKQFLDMRNDYHEQLDQIEKAFLRERNDIIAKNEEEIRQLFDQHKSLEEEYMHKRSQKEEHYTSELEKLRTQDANDQAEQKIKLEKEMQILQKCMEDMKAVYRLNEEKLDFNQRVLKEREKVNKSAIDGLKKRLRRYKENLGLAKKKFEAQTKKYARDNKMMTKDYKKFTKEFLLLQIKYERFEKSDKNRFNEIWSMNQNEVMALCEKLKECDRVIHVQQLGPLHELVPDVLQVLDLGPEQLVVTGLNILQVLEVLQLLHGFLRSHQFVFLNLVQLPLGGGEGLLELPAGVALAAELVVQLLDLRDQQLDVLLVVLSLREGDLCLLLSLVLAVLNV